MLRGYTKNNSVDRYNQNDLLKKDLNNKNIIYSAVYEPVLGSDIFCELPPKYKNFKPDYQNKRVYEVFYSKKSKEEKDKAIVMAFRNQSTTTVLKKPKNKKNVVDIKNIKYGSYYDPFKTTYNSCYKANKINPETLVGNNTKLGTGVAYNSRKTKIDDLKSNIFYDGEKYYQNSNLRDNFDPKNINHNNWYTKLDWRNDKSELIFYKNNQKEFYDKNSRANDNCFELYK